MGIDFLWDRSCKYMKKSYLLIVLLLQFIYAEGQTFSFDKFNFFLSPKILEDGSIIDFGLGYNYTDIFGSSLDFRITNTSKNEKLLGVEDSLNATNENIFETFFFPVKYNFFRNFLNSIWVGAGLYYEYNKLNENGYFNMPSLETLNPPRERVNSYTNDFSMHLLGPLIGIGANYSSKWFGINFYGGVIPIFYLTSKQKTSIVPLIYPNNAEYSQNTAGTPHFYINMDAIILKYLNIVLLYEFARLNYETIDFDENLAWKTADNAIITQSFKVETSLLIPMGNNMRMLVGYGYALDSMRLDSNDAILSGRHYLILTAKKQ
jgi:hypothetical protein